MQAIDIIHSAYAKSAKNQPGKIANESVELLGVLNRAMVSLFAAGERVNPYFYGAKQVVAYNNGGWQRPSSADVVYRIEMPDNSEVVIVPFNDRNAEPSKPSVYPFGQYYFSVGNTAGPTIENLTFYFSKGPTPAQQLTDNIDSRFPEAFIELPIHEVAIYLAIKDGRFDELPILLESRNMWLKLYINFLEHETVGIRKRFSHNELFNTQSILSINDLLYQPGNGA